MQRTVEERNAVSNRHPVFREVFFLLRGAGRPYLVFQEAGMGETVGEHRLLTKKALPLADTVGQVRLAAWNHV